MSHIADNINIVRKNIALACEKAGRKPEEVTLIAVSKTVGVESVKEAVACGITCLGENKVQEIMEKQPSLAEAGVQWHMIGHLQTNKVKAVINKVEMIQSLDSMRLAEEIHKRAAEAGKVMDVLVEINIGSEDSKYGLLPMDALDFSRFLLDFDNLRHRGFMCVAPFVENQEENRVFFQKMRHLFIDIRSKIKHNEYMDCLSMGMTNDYGVAIEEGATMVRIGTGIFGARN